MAKSKNDSKDEEVKNRVSNLLKDVFPSKKEKATETVDVLEEANDNNGVEWLQEELDRLTLLNEEIIQENQQLRGDVEKAMAEIHSLKNSSNAPVNGEDFRSGVISLFNDLENNYLGRNSTSTRYYDANVKVLLDKMLGIFPFLMNR